MHVRRLRAKLGAENEALIGTVRNVGYRFVPIKTSPGAGAADADGAVRSSGADLASDDDIDALDSADELGLPTVAHADR